MKVLDCPRARAWATGMICPEPQVSIAFSTLNSCSVITRDESQSLNDSLSH